MRLLTTILCFLTTPLWAGTITISSTSLSAFGNVYPFHSSTSQRYLISGTSLINDLTITADPNFEISTTFGDGFSKSIVITPSSGMINLTTVFVRFSPIATGSATGSIVNSSVGSTSQSVSVSGSCIAWAIPTSSSNYYSTASGRGSTLKTNLYTKISGHTAVGYTPGVWNAFATSDVQLNGKVWDIYSTRLDSIPPYEFTFVTDQDNGTGGSSEGDKYNREHSFPQSWFGGSVTPMVSDMHHIFATDKKVNNQRSNNPYGLVSLPSFTSLIGGKLGPNNTSGFTGTAFEPIDEYKGDVARAQLYMVTRYENLITAWQSNGNANDVLAGNTFPGYDSWYIDLLQSWHNLDPVSDKEIKRNNAIYALQNNRNPFIDSPHFVQRIWGGTIPAEPTVSSNNLTISNINNTSVTLHWKSGNGNRRVVLVKANSSVNGFPLDTFHYLANANLSLAPQLGTGNYIVYNGTGSSVTLTNLTQGTAYQYAVVEYNGWYTTSNYQSSGILTGGGTTLPVDITTFTAEKQSPIQVFIKWTTVSENNNHYFTVERSLDSQIWDSIAALNAAGTSNRIHNYQFLDTPPNTSAIVYYRLKQTDFDGKFTHSRIVSVDFSQTGINFIELPQISIVPNPFHNQFKISAHGFYANEVVLSIQNIMGETIVKYLIPVHNDQIDYAVSIADELPSGVYFVQLEHNQNKQFAKLIKQ